LARPAGVRVAERPAGADGRWGLRAVHLSIDGPVLVELRRDGVPGLLRDDEDADPELGHDPHRLGRHGGRVGAPAERPEGLRADRLSRLLDEGAVVLAMALLEAAEQHLGALDEALARLLHRHAEALELDPAEAPPEAQDEP